MSGLDGSKQQEVDYQVYLKYHNRVTKTLMSQDEGADFDEHEQREFANEVTSTSTFAAPFLDSCPVPLDSRLDSRLDSLLRSSLVGLVGRLQAVWD